MPQDTHVYGEVKNQTDLKVQGCPSGCSLVLPTRDEQRTYPRCAAH